MWTKTLQQVPTSNIEFSNVHKSAVLWAIFDEKDATPRSECSGLAKLPAQYDNRCQECDTLFASNKTVVEARTEGAVDAWLPLSASEAAHM